MEKIKMNIKLKILIGILILGILIAVGFIFCSTRRVVTITTDKTEYKRGETVKMTVGNGLGRSVWRSGQCGGYYPFWGLQKFENSEWKWLDFSLPYLEEGEEVCDFTLCERAEPVEFKSGSKLSYDWRLSICEWPEKPVGVPKTEPKFIGEGTYRVSFTYGLGKDEEGFGLLEAKTIYSSEFTIKYLE